MDRELTHVEKLVTDTFTAHEHLTPDSDTVLAAARQRMDRRRAVLSRPLAVAAGVAAVALAAVTVVAVSRPALTSAGDAAGRADGVEPVVDLVMPYSLGWLPPGPVEHASRRINIGATAEDLDTPLYGGEYMLTVNADGQDVFVDVQQFRMTPVEDARFKSGPGRAVTVGGQPGVESSRSGGPGGYELYVAHPDGGSMYVNVSAGPGRITAAQLDDIGRRIAENIRFPGTTTVTPNYGLRDLPDGLRVCAFGVSGPSEFLPEGGTDYSLGTCDTMPPIFVNNPVGDVPPGTVGEPVQGHETRYAKDEGGYRVWVLDAVNGGPVTVHGDLPLADLYEVANRLVLPR
jgi:hypothetical protein